MTNTPDVAICSLSMFGSDARILIYLGATYYFVSREFVIRVGMIKISLACRLEFSTSLGESFSLNEMLKDNLFCIEDQVVETNLILIDLHGIDVTFSMDWLTSNYASVDCFHKEVIFR